MREEWKVIPDCPNYSVSNMGRVMRSSPGPRTHVGLIKKQMYQGGRYPFVLLCKGPGQQRKHVLYVHLAVAEAFCPNPDPARLTVVRHLNGNYDDNRAENLEWTTYKNQAQDWFKGVRLNSMEYRLVELFRSHPEKFTRLLS